MALYVVRLSPNLLAHALLPTKTLNHMCFTTHLTPGHLVVEPDVGCCWMPLDAQMNTISTKWADAWQRQRNHGDHGEVDVWVPAQLPNATTNHQPQTQLTNKPFCTHATCLGPVRAFPALEIEAGWVISGQLLWCNVGYIAAWWKVVAAW